MATWGDIFDSPDPGEKAPDPGAISADGTPVATLRPVQPRKTINRINNGVARTLGIASELVERAGSAK